MKDKHFKLSDKEILEELDRVVDNTKIALKDNSEWKKEIRSNISKCIEILSNW